MKRARRAARGPLPLRPGPARLGQDVDGRAADRAPARARQARRRRRDEPQGDPQPARRGRARSAAGGRRFRGLKKATQQQPGVRVRRATGRERRADFADPDDDVLLSPARPGSSAREELDRQLDYLFVDEAGPGRRSPTRSRWATCGAQRSSCSATRCSSRRSRRASTRAARGARCSSTCSATRRRSRRSAASSSSARAGCTRTSAASSRRRSTRAGSSRRRECARQSTGLGTGLRFLPVEHEGNRPLVARGGGRDRGEIERLLGGSGRTRGA